MEDSRVVVDAVVVDSATWNVHYAAVVWKSQSYVIMTRFRSDPQSIYCVIFIKIIKLRYMYHIYLLVVVEDVVVVATI